MIIKEIDLHIYTIAMVIYLILQKNNGISMDFLLLSMPCYSSLSYYLRTIN